MEHEGLLNKNPATRVIFRSVDDIGPEEQDDRDIDAGRQTGSPTNSVWKTRYQGWLGQSGTIKIPSALFAQIFCITLKIRQKGVMHKTVGFSMTL